MDFNYKKANDLDFQDESNSISYSEILYAPSEILIAIGTNIVMAEK